MVKQFVCEDENFMVQSNDENEVMDMAMDHMRKFHPDAEMGPEDLRDQIQDI
jgi:predicted small metal-binding protein